MSNMVSRAEVLPCSLFKLSLPNVLSLGPLSVSEMVDDIRALLNILWIITNKLYFRDGWRHPRPRRLASSQDQDLRLQSGHGMCLLQGVSYLKLLLSSTYHIGEQHWNVWFQPMIDYVDTKERQGIFFERPVSVSFFFFFDQWVSFFLFLLTLEFLGKHQITKKSCPPVLGGPKFCDLWYFARPSKSTFPLKYIYSDIFISFIFPDRESPPSPPCGAGHDEPWGWVSNYFPINQQQQQTIKQSKTIRGDQLTGTGNLERFLVKVGPLSPRKAVPAFQAM